MSADQLVVESPWLLLAASVVFVIVGFVAASGWNPRRSR